MGKNIIYLSALQRNRKHERYTLNLIVTWQFTVQSLFPKRHLIPFLFVDSHSFLVRLQILSSKLRSIHAISQSRHTDFSSPILTFLPVTAITHSQKIAFHERRSFLSLFWLATSTNLIVNRSILYRLLFCYIILIIHHHFRIWLIEVEMTHFILSFFSNILI